MTDRTAEKREAPQAERTYAERLEHLMQVCIAELEAIGIHPSRRIVSVAENRRAKKRLGCCRTVSVGGKRGFVLEISTQLAEKENRAVQEVLLHELLHTCPGCLDHGDKWKELAESVNRAYGYEIRATADYGRYGLAQPPAPPRRYAVRCRSCGHVVYRTRRGRVVDHPEHYRCARCGGRLEVIEGHF